jgi:cytochrome b subunit of formate dehydrogenase
MLTGNASAMENSECLECHGEEDLTASRDGHEVSFFVNQDVYAVSVHGANEVACNECHGDVTDDHPDEQQHLEKVDCSGCHDQADTVAASIHGDQNALCQDCHGSHAILPGDNPQSNVYPLNIPATCGKCHNDDEMMGEESAAYTAAYNDGQHGVSTSKGMLGAAVCTDCHGTHDIVAASEPDSPASRGKINPPCGTCHAGTLGTYKQSIHGRAMTGGDASAPTCISCHNPHRTLRVDRDEFQLGNVETCGGCHHHDYSTYRASYHGQITDLGYTKMAKCATCHGDHNILPSSDPASMTNEGQLLETCQQCHPSAGENFIGFAPHLDHGDKEKFPVESAIFGVMSALLINVFLIFSIHTLLWFIRSMFSKLKGEEPPHLGNPTGRYFLRFNYYQRIMHFLVFTSFVVLSVTGLPLKFHSTEWARMLAAALGGFEVCGILHRMMGAVTFGYFALHLGYLAYLWITGRMKLTEILWGPKSMVPQPKDAMDIADMVKWFLGLGPQPRFSRFTYWEKFDYFAVFWGVALIGLSGLVLWLPELFTKLLPGIVINIAWIIHADEALLATGFIFLIHFYNTHLRVEKFPLDPVILTGRIDEEELRHERPEEFDYRRKDGSLREIETTKAPPWMKNMARAIGWTFVFIGLALLVGMMSAFFV